MPLSAEIPDADITYRIIGCAMRVHRRLGPGLRERHYQRALTAEMVADGLAVSEEHPLEIYDAGVWLGRLYLDHLVESRIVVEDKALAHLLTNDELAQVITYLAASGFRVGLLLNFGRRRLEYKRILPPKQVTEWQQSIQRYVWRPSNAK